MEASGDHTTGATAALTISCRRVLKLRAKSMKQQIMRQRAPMSGIAAMAMEASGDHTTAALTISCRRVLKLRAKSMKQQIMRQRTPRSGSAAMAMEATGAHNTGLDMPTAAEVFLATSNLKTF